MGRIAKGLNAVAGQLDTIQKHPALLLTPEQHRQAVAQAGSGLMREAVQALDRAAQNAVHERQQLAGLIGATRVQDQQFRALCWASGIALAVGLVLSPLVASLLPFGLNTRVASLVMREDRWDAGTALMQAASPSDWGRLIDSAHLVRLNDDVLRACREAAAKAKKAERCTITVSAN
jgi:hypothetical protein